MHGRAIKKTNRIFYKFDKSIVLVKGVVSPGRKIARDWVCANSPIELSRIGILERGHPESQ